MIIPAKHYTNQTKGIPAAVVPSNETPTPPTATTTSSQPPSTDNGPALNTSSQDPNAMPSTTTGADSTPPSSRAPSSTPPPSSSPSSAPSTSEPSTRPQASQPPKLPYHVSRTPSAQLPVYKEAKRGGNLRQTRVRKVSGDVKALRDALRRLLDLPDGEVMAKREIGQVVVKGWWKERIVRFLESKRF